MKKVLCITSLVLCIFVSACTDAASIGIIGGADGPTSIIVGNGEKEMYKQITAEDAKRIIDSGEECVILDVREQEEFDEGHIAGAILIPHEKISEKAEEMMPDKDKQILVYCRSGRRSKIAAEALAELGYTDIKEFGGIIDWTYGVEK